jgi:hypothetical protein
MIRFSAVPFRAFSCLMLSQFLSFESRADEVVWRQTLDEQFEAPALDPKI